MPRLPIEAAVQLAHEHLLAGRLSLAAMVVHALGEDGGPAGAALTAKIAGHPLAIDDAHALVREGFAYQETGQWADAETRYRWALVLAPQLFLALNNLGIALQMQGRLGEAIDAYKRALALSGPHASILPNLALALHQCGQFEEAAAVLRQSLSLDPQNADAWSNLGVALLNRGAVTDAVEAFTSATRVNPKLATAWFNLGTALDAQGQWQEAEDAYRRALALQPGYTAASNNLATVVQAQGRLNAAEQVLRDLLQRFPESSKAEDNLANVLHNQGRVEEALPHYQAAMRLDPAAANIHSNYLYALHYREGITSAELAEAHAEWDRRHGQSPAWCSTSAARARSSSLRVGFVSSDLGEHPVGRFLIRVVESLPASEVDLFFYSDRGRVDALTERFRRRATAWHDTRAIPHQPLAELIRGERLDFLFDLAGHSAHNRLPTLVYRPAPIQLAWMGYEGTTGLSAIDYLLADEHVVPEGEERFYREKLLRLPTCYITFDPPAGAPAPGPPPCLSTGRITFASFSNPAKINRRVVALWASVLGRVPRSRLLLKYRGFDDPAVAARYRRLFADQGIDGPRLELAGWSTYEECLQEYQKVDIALDPFPFAGGATTCDALWMGVPVVSLVGGTFAGRHGLSYLSAVGIREWAVDTPDAYLATAVALAENRQRLAQWRGELRERVASSALCDGERVAQALLELLRGIR